MLLQSAPPDDGWGVPRPEPRGMLECGNVSAPHPKPVLRFRSGKRNLFGSLLGFSRHRLSGASLEGPKLQETLVLRGWVVLAFPLVVLAGPEGGCAPCAKARNPNSEQDVAKAVDIVRCCDDQHRVRNAPTALRADCSDDVAGRHRCPTVRTPDNRPFLRSDTDWSLPRHVLSPWM